MNKNSFSLAWHPNTDILLKALILLCILTYKIRLNCQHNAIFIPISLKSTHWAVQQWFFTECAWCSRGPISPGASEFCCWSLISVKLLILTLWPPAHKGGVALWLFCSHGVHFPFTLNLESSLRELSMWATFHFLVCFLLTSSESRRDWDFHFLSNWMNVWRSFPQELLVLYSGQESPWWLVRCRVQATRAWVPAACVLLSQLYLPFPGGGL